MFKPSIVPSSSSFLRFSPNKPRPCIDCLRPVSSEQDYYSFCFSLFSRYLAIKMLLLGGHDDLN